MPTFQESSKTVFYTIGVKSFAKPYIAVTAILVVNTMKFGGVKTFATGVHNLTQDGVWSFYFYRIARHMIFFWS